MKWVIKYTLIFTVAFLAFHGLSLLSFFVPALRPIFYFLFLGAAAVCAFWKPAYTAIPIILALLLDSSGHLFEWHDVSLRLAVFIVTMLAWKYHHICKRDLFAELKTPFTLIYAIVMICVAFAAWNGYHNGHAIKSIIGDAIPFLYLTLWYPLKSLREASPTSDEAIPLILGSFLGAALLSLITLFLFSSGLQEIHGPFYTWWRDWVAGKATSTGNGFFRIVTPLHLFLTALVPYVILRLRAEGSHPTGFFAGLRMTKTRWLLLVTILLVPVINFSRIYFLAIIPATLIMAWKLPWKKVMFTLILIGTISLAEYAVINLAASRGTSLGFEFITKQSRGIIDPESEASASARAAILPRLIEKIKNRPLLGEGLGASVTYYNPYVKKELTTPHLDWGYLELAVEFGLLVTLFFLGLILWLLWKNRTNALGASVLVFLLVTTLTSPALFHVYGISLILVLIMFSSPARLDKTTLK